MEREQLTHTPAMRGNPGSHSRCAIDSWLAHRRRYAQTLMRRAKVVDCADQIHPVFQRAALAGERPPAARQRGQALAEGGVEPFNVGGVEHAGTALRAVAQLFDLRRRASQNAALDADHTPLHVVLADLGDMEVFPGAQVGPARLAYGERIAKGFSDRTGVGPTANALQLR